MNTMVENKYKLGACNHDKWYQEFLIYCLGYENQMEDSERFDEELYTTRLEEGYDIFDEKDVKWLLLKHPDKVYKNWLEKIPTSSKQSSSQVNFNYSSSYV